MKIHNIVCLCALTAFPPLAFAEAPLDGKWLGQLQSVLDFCAQNNPQSAMKYRELAKQLLENATAQDVAAARRTEGYREGYEANRAAFNQLPKDEAAVLCNTIWDSGTREQPNAPSEPPDQKTQLEEGAPT